MKQHLLGCLLAWWTAGGIESSIAPVLLGSAADEDFAYGGRTHYCSNAPNVINIFSFSKVRLLKNEKVPVSSLIVVLFQGVTCRPSKMWLLLCALQAYGMMGWRVGYIAYPTADERLGMELLKVQDTVSEPLHLQLAFCSKIDIPRYQPASAVSCTSQLYCIQSAQTVSWVLPPADSYLCQPAESASSSSSSQIWPGVCAQPD
jgi:hypothetical protein